MSVSHVWVSYSTYAPFASVTSIKSMCTWYISRAVNMITGTIRATVYSYCMPLSLRQPVLLTLTSRWYSNALDTEQYVLLQE